MSSDDTTGDPIGWTIIAIGDNGSVLCQSPTGNRRRYLFYDQTEQGDNVHVPVPGRVVGNVAVKWVEQVEPHEGGE